MAAGAVALLLGAPASAATYSPSLVVSSTTSVLAATGSTTLQIVEAEGDDPIAKIDVRAPAGYGVALSQPFGSTIGTVEIRGKTEPGGTDVHLFGPIRAEAPAQYAQAAATCTGQERHDAVWLVSLGGSLTSVPAFIDVTGTGIAAASARIQLCLPQPGSPGFGARLTRVSLSVTGVFRNPGASGDYRWSGLFDPYPTAPGPEQVQSQSIVRLPPRLTLTRTLLVRRNRTFVFLRGQVAENGHGVAGARVEILAGRSAGLLERFVFATSFGKGTFEVVAPLSRPTVFRAKVTVAARSAPASTCLPIPGSTAPCTSASFAAFRAQSKIITARPPRR